MEGYELWILPFGTGDAYEHLEENGYELTLGGTLANARNWKATTFGTTTVMNLEP